MINTIQPLVNLTNANLQALLRFMQAATQGESTNSRNRQYVGMPDETMQLFYQSAALSQLAHDTFENLTSFVSECMDCNARLLKESPFPLGDLTRNAEQAASSALRAVKRAAASAQQQTAEAEAASRDASRGSKGKYRQLAV